MCGDGRQRPRRRHRRAQSLLDFPGARNALLKECLVHFVARPQDFQANDSFTRNEAGHQSRTRVDDELREAADFHLRVLLCSLTLPHTRGEPRLGFQHVARDRSFGSPRKRNSACAAAAQPARTSRPNSAYRQRTEASLPWRSHSRDKRRTPPAWSASALCRRGGCGWPPLGR